MNYTEKHIHSHLYKHAYLLLHNMKVVAEVHLQENFSKKNKMVLHYQWEGVLKEGAPTYHWRAMEIIKTDPISRKIISIDAIWTEKQFRDQFKNK